MFAITTLVPRPLNWLLMALMLAARSAGVAQRCGSAVRLTLAADTAGDPDTAMYRELERSELGSNAAHRWASMATFRPGELVAGRYIVEAFLARGGMGELY